MMSRNMAIGAILRASVGDGVNRSLFPERMRGKLAKSLWDDPAFTLGVEYGYILALMRAFNITEEDLCSMGGPHD